MGYREAIEAAGAVVHASEDFGDYQGTSWAKVTYQGVTGWVSWGFGSCSGCDAYEHWESDFRGSRWNDDSDMDPEPSQEELAKFGRNYLDDIMSQERAESEAARDIEWDSEAEKVVSFLRNNKINEV